MPDTCSGAISPDVVDPCDSPSASGTDTFTIDESESADLLVVGVASTDGAELPFTLTDPSGAAVSCVAPSFGQNPQCATSASGTYTLAVTNQGSDYTVSYLALLSDSTCTALDPSFASAPVEGSVAAGAAGACFTLDMTSGHTVAIDFGNGATSYLSTPLGIYDATGAQVCFNGYGTCVLSGIGPYRALTGNNQGTAFTFGLSLNDLTDPVGCAAASQLAYGVAPDDSSADECRTLTVKTADEYQVYAAGDWSLGGVSGTLYTSAGATACTNSGPFCALTPGTYYYVENQDPLAPYDFAVGFVAADEKHGCAATGIKDFATGPAAASFSGVGESVCLTLPAAATGKSLYVYDENPTATGYAAPLLVLDSTGAQTCTNLYNDSGTCTPTGTAPFHVVLDAQTIDNPSYKVLIQATDSTAGCAVWKQSGYGSSFGATVTTSYTSNYACLTLPADKHAVGEMVDYTDTTNTEDGGISINDSAGDQACLVLITSLCTFQPGVTYTAILSNSGQAQTYDLVRRDDTSSATCSTPASLTPGAPSTATNFTSAITAHCYRVSAAATDDMWFDVRTTAPYPAGAILAVTDGTGALVCNFVTICQTDGSTDYQVIAIASGYAGTTIAGHLDTWQMATAAGPAAVCAANQLSVDGWGPTSLKLTESAPAYCATISLSTFQSFDVYDAVSGNGAQPLIDVYPLNPWKPPYSFTDGICFGSDCNTASDSGEAIVLVSLNGAQSPVNLTEQGVCGSGCTRPAAPTISAISPARQPAGTAQKVTVTGTNLNLGTTVMLATAGNPVAYASISQPVSVSADGTSLTVLLNTSAVTPGKYDVMLNADYTIPTTSPNYLSNAYTVTAAPTAAGS
ncbi:IPT/TIG domain-containing protein [Actinospica robiniae]|uniref:IPT/TIG domain-containing protein n=1 Tax=Actinospica robiniae TaxID=304901 RepID=UPI0005556800|nr:IPT/TIG domain-containing protein [Actinospica robiniae]